MISIILYRNGGNLENGKKEKQSSLDRLFHELGICGNVWSYKNSMIPCILIHVRTKVLREVEGKSGTILHKLSI